jgi:hypothetical protein
MPLFCNVYVYLCAFFLCVEMKKCTQRSIYEEEGVIMMAVWREREREEMEIDVFVYVCVSEEMNESLGNYTRDAHRLTHFYSIVPRSQRCSIERTQTQHRS